MRVIFTGFLFSRLSPSIITYTPDVLPSYFAIVNQDNRRNDNHAPLRPDQPQIVYKYIYSTIARFLWSTHPQRIHLPHTHLRKTHACVRARAKTTRFSESNLCKHYRNVGINRNTHTVLIIYYDYVYREKILLRSMNTVHC